MLSVGGSAALDKATDSPDSTSVFILRSDAASFVLPVPPVSTADTSSQSGLSALDLQQYDSMQIFADLGLKKNSVL